MNLSQGPPLRIALAQINTTVGDVTGNARKIIAFIEQARTLGTDLVVFPEMAITGYPPEDLLLKPDVIVFGFQVVTEPCLKLWDFHAGADGSDVESFLKRSGKHVSGVDQCAENCLQ